MTEAINITREDLDHYDPENHIFQSKPGLSREIVEAISKQKNEPEWMLKKRLKAFELFEKTSMPSWGPDISDLDINKIIYFSRPDAKSDADNWDDVPEDIKRTFDRLGIPEAERKSLGGVGAQYDSDVVYHSLKKEWEDKGVIFLDMDDALQQHPELVRKYFMTNCVPINDHKFAMLHAAVWSGGTFIYVPKNVKVELPLQAYFRMNARKGGQFEHTLIVVDEGAEVHYIEGCSAPQYTENSLHAGCVEVYVHKNARARYSSIENWSKNTYNLNTKRAIVHEDAVMEWVNGNMGCLTENSKVFTNPKGPKNIKDIKKGDKVFVWDEKSNSLKRSLVKCMIFSGMKQVYKLRCGGREIEATDNHPFLTLVRRKNNPQHKKGFFHFEWKPLKNLKEGDLLGLVKKLPVEGRPYELPRHKFEKIESNNQYSKFKMRNEHLYNKNIRIPKGTNNDFMWLAGILIGDGYIDLGNNKINIAVPKTDDIREEVCRVVKELFNYEITYKKDRYIIINSKVLAYLFTNIGLGGDAKTKRMPDWVFGLPREQILSFLAGYFDSDGHPGDRGIYLTSINKELLEKIKLLAITLGYGVSKVFKHREKGKTYVCGNLCKANGSWRILLNGPQITNFPSRSKKDLEKIFRIRSWRNYNMAKGLNFKSRTNEDIGFARIDEIKPLDVKPTYDIEVEGYHNFIANGLIVHNSKVTMLYPSSILLGRNARSDYLGIAYAGKGQDQDTGSKAVHLAPNTKSVIKAKSISKDGGRASYRGWLKVAKGATNCKTNVQCDALILDPISKSDTFPTIENNEEKVDIAHEATVGKVSEDQIFYLMSRGLSEEEAIAMIVSGFIEPVTKQLPLEYAIELNRLIELEMEGSVG